MSCSFVVIQCRSNKDCTKTYSTCVNRQCTCKGELILGKKSCEPGKEKEFSISRIAVFKSCVLFRDPVISSHSLSPPALWARGASNLILLRYHLDENIQSCLLWYPLAAYQALLASWVFGSNASEQNLNHGSAKMPDTATEDYKKKTISSVTIATDQFLFFCYCNSLEAIYNCKMSGLHFETQYILVDPTFCYIFFFSAFACMRWRQWLQYPGKMWRRKMHLSRKENWKREILQRYGQLTTRISCAMVYLSNGRQAKETQKLMFSWLSWLAVMLVEMYERRRRWRRSRAKWRPYLRRCFTWISPKQWFFFFKSNKDTVLLYSVPLWYWASMLWSI